MATSQGSITVSPGVPAYATARAKQLGLPNRSILLAILLHNYLQGPLQLLPIVESPPRLVKVRMQLSIPRSLRKESAKAAVRCGYSLSELVESLLIYDAAREHEHGELVLWSVSGMKKPELE